MRRLFPVVLLLLVWLAPAARALDPARDLDGYSLRTWREGLPQYLIRTIVQTADGYIWAGTMEGVARFNGLQFDIFDPSNTPSLTDQRIRTLVEDAGGTLWIATFNGGIDLYRNGRFESLRGLPGNAITALAASRDGSMWIAIPGALVHWRAGALQQFPRDRRSEVTAIAEAPNGEVWLGTSSGVERFDGRTLTRVDAGEPLNVVSLAAAHDGTIWAGSTSDRIHRFRPGGAHDVIRTGFTTAYVHTIREDRRGVVWIGTSPGGLARFRNGAFERMDKSNGLPTSSVRSLLEDREGNLWVGTDGGLGRLADLKFVNYTSSEGLSDDAIRVVTESRSGGLWVGTYGGGVNLLRGGKVTTFNPGTSTLFVRSMSEDAAGVLWIGTDRGLARLRDGAVAMIGPPDKIDAVQTVRDGTLLVSTPHGLQSVTGETFAPFLPGVTDVRAILEASDGSIWLATYGGIVEVRDRRIVRRLTTRDGLASNMTFALLEDASHDLWVGTHEGLSCLRAGSSRAVSVTTRDGLPHNVVFQILDDRRGNFWLTSNRGLARVELRSIADVLAGRARQLRARSFGKQDGLGDDQCNGATQPAGVTMRDGRLAIPTIGGLTIVDPADLHFNHQPPGVVLREVLIDGKRVAGVPAVSWRASHYEFRYDGLSFVQPERTRFAYRMDGFDEKWIDAGTRRTAFYNSLPPGRHVFHVIAFNNDGVESSADASFAFDLEPPPSR